jgi:hypothetical protein
MTRSKGWWLAVIESYPCDVCGVGPGERCVTNTLAPKSEPHASRARQADRCTVCGQRVHAESESDLCDRHERVRQLELERVTTWKRLHE